jgi:hypothetical protein
MQIELEECYGIEICSSVYPEENISIYYDQQLKDIFIPEELCILLMKQDGWGLQYAHNQTPELCLEAVKRHGTALEYVHNQTILNNLKNGKL